MRKIAFTFLFLVITLVSLSAQSTLAYLNKQGTATQLVLPGKPFLILGGELGNSSASSSEDVECIFPKLQRMGLNTVLVPAYWDLIEPTEGTYNFSQIDKAINQAKKNHLKVVFLWFGAWKNSMSCYAPLWFKKNTRRFPRAFTADGKQMEIASAFSENVLSADKNALSALMHRIDKDDPKHDIVVMMQVENEIGMLESARDHSHLAEKTFLKSSFAMDQKSFSLEDEERFQAEYYAKYVEVLAKT